MLLHSVSQLASRLGRPATKWDSRAFYATGDVVADTVYPANWEPRYLNLLWKPVSVPISTSIDAALETTPQPLLLDPVVDGATGANAVWVRHTVYVPPPFVPIILSGKLRPFEAWQRLRGELVTDNLEADYWEVVDWLRFALVCSAPNAFYHLFTAKNIDPLVEAVLLNHQNDVLIWDLPGLDPSLSRATGYLIATNIGELVTKQRAVRMEAETIWMWK